MAAEEDRAPLRTPNTRRGPNAVTLAVCDHQLRATLASTLRRSRLGHHRNVLANGTELLESLGVSGDSDAPHHPPLPNLILTCLEGDTLSYRTLFRTLKGNSRLRPIPVVIFVQRGQRARIPRLYELGASSVVQLPLHFTDLVEILRVMEHYWNDVVRLPDPNH